MGSKLIDWTFMLTDVSTCYPIAYSILNHKSCHKPVAGKGRDYNNLLE
jgi:hypothetical protein